MDSLDGEGPKSTELSPPPSRVLVRALVRLGGEEEERRKNETSQWGTK